MYYAFFGLKQPPFRITPDTDFFFEVTVRAERWVRRPCATHSGHW